MRFLSPEWLIVLPALLLVGRQWPVLGIFRPLRLLVLVLLTLTLMRPELRRTTSGTDLWVVWDVSASAADTLEPHRAEYEKLLRENMSADDRLMWMDYAEDSSVRDVASNIIYGAGLNATRTARAVRDAFSRMSPDRNNRVLVVTDGYSTEPVGPLREALVAGSVRLDCRIVSPVREGDAAVSGIDAPMRVRVREPFVLNATVAGPDGNLPYAVLRDGKVLHRGVTKVTGGRGHISVSDRIPLSGSSKYAVRVEMPKDTAPGNDTRDIWIEAAGEQRVLLVTGYDNDPLVGVLTGKGFVVEVCREPGTLHAGRLSGARAVILNNVPANEFKQGMPEAFAFYVREQGGGLMMIGGKNSFASGAWWGSALDPVLPVSMELKDETRRILLNMAISLDRSGSMGASVGSMTKMDLADAGAAAAVKLLGSQDRVVVHAVDSEAHEIVPLTPVGPNRDAIANQILKIESTGGGIFVNTALREAWARIKNAPGGRKHIVLFADACDAEDSDSPGSWKTLVPEIVRGGGTVSCIGMGSDTDCDAQYLKDIAKLGGGRAFFNADPNNLPALFSQEAMSVSRSSFIEDKTGAKGATGWLELSASSPAWLSSVDGYNLCYTRPEAVADAITTDEYKAPLVAHMRVGSGRTAAVTFPLGGDFSATARAWPGYGDLVQTLVRWVENPVQLDGVAVRADLDGEKLAVELRYTDKPGAYDWTTTFAKKPPALLVAQGDDAKGRNLVWEKVRPGLYRTTLDLRDTRAVRGAVQIEMPGDKPVRAAIPFGPLAVQSGAELQTDPGRPEELRALSESTGGRELLNLARAWEGGGVARYTDFTRILLATLMAVVLLEALATRIGRWNSWRR